MSSILRSIAALALACAAVAAGATPLTTLLNGGSLVVGDKLFDQWRLIGSGLVDTTGQVDLANIEVIGLDDQPLNPGLRFEANGELQLSGDHLIDLFLGYRVSVLPGGSLMIKDVSFGFDAGGWSGDGGTAAHEEVFDAAGALLGSIDLEASAVNFDIAGSVEFAPRSQLFIEKNILLFGLASADSTFLTSFTQRFSQVPEAQSAALLALAIAALAALRRRRATAG